MICRGSVVTLFGDFTPYMLLTITFIYTFTSQHVPPGAADGTSCASGAPCNVTLKGLQDQHVLHGVPGRVDQVAGQRTGFSQLTPHYVVYPSNLPNCNRSWKDLTVRCGSRQKGGQGGQGASHSAVLCILRRDVSPVTARALASPSVKEAAW